MTTTTTDEAAAAHVELIAAQTNLERLYPAYRRAVARRDAAILRAHDEGFSDSMIAEVTGQHRPNVIRTRQRMKKKDARID